MSSPEQQEQMRIFANNLKRELDNRGKNQTDLADFIGVSSATTSDWINGKKMPRMDKIQSMANWFGLQKSNLLEDMSPDEVLSGNYQRPYEQFPSDYPIKRPLTEEEFHLVELYKKLDDTDRIKVMERIVTLLDDDKYKKDSMEGGEVG